MDKVQQLNEWMEKYISEELFDLNENVKKVPLELGNLYHGIAIKKDNVEWVDIDPYEELKVSDIPLTTKVLYDLQARRKPIIAKMAIGYYVASKTDSYQDFKNLIYPYILAATASLKSKVGFGPEIPLIGNHYLTIIKNPETHTLIAEIENSAAFYFLISHDCKKNLLFYDKEQQIPLL